MTHVRRHQFFTVGTAFLVIMVLLMSSGFFVQSAPAVSLSYRLKSFGYNDDEIADILSHRRSRREVDLEIRLKTLGYTNQEIKEIMDKADSYGNEGAIPSNDKIPYFHLVKDAAKQTGVDPHLVLAVIKAESNFDPNAVSSSGAMGLMQLMPETALEMGVQDVYNPRDNIWAGTRYLSYCLEKFGDTEMALAAYNAGPGVVERLNQVPDKPETRNYIRRVMRFISNFKTGGVRTARHSKIRIEPLVTVEDDNLSSPSELLAMAGPV
jgi:soluble lytic murein transglycosylase-like protein